VSLEEDAPLRNELIENEDFYYNEQGYKVFTEKYHLKRGYCCQNGCKHCPYGFHDKKKKQEW
jgi:Family of unknown function (DUF5522)